MGMNVVQHMNVSAIKKCFKTGKLNCPSGYEPRIVENDKCCASEKCIKITGGNINGFNKNTESGVNVHNLLEQSKFIFGDDSDKDGSYPYGTFKATGDAKASGDAEAYAPFDVHGDFKGGEYSGKDGKQGMIVVGGADVDGKAYADGETGYGKGMYYGQPSGMMWPGMDGKIHSDATASSQNNGVTYSLDNFDND